MARLQAIYRKDGVEKMTKRFGYKNTQQVPKLEKIVINIGMGEALQNIKSIDAAEEQLRAITGQKPKVTKAKKSIATFKLRKGVKIGLAVTLRGARMYEFFDRLVNVALPRVKDFRGVPKRGMDGRGNYTLGLKEQIIFPEIEYDKVDRTRGMNLTFVTTAVNDEEGLALLGVLGMPFRN